MTDPAIARPHRRPLARLADVSYRRRRSVLVAWLLGTIAIFALSTSFAGDPSADYAAHGSDSDQAQELLDSRFPADAGQSIDHLYKIVKTRYPKMDWKKIMPGTKLPHTSIELRKWRALMYDKHRE